MHQYKELKVWQKAMSITKLTYKLCEGFPDNERYGLVSQMRRAAVSMPSNIAEGAGRNSKLEFRQFLAIANGSAYELETQLLLANSFGYISAESLNTISIELTELQKMLFGLQKSLIEKQ
ncbi:four helix bundle protein [Hymenobacter sp. ISL-91]|uniref:four helix bundle protein n=1 Tax=Hymenobacter sp. ISL-91 TaxID=2819151 RepID=UPI001BEB3DDD|nr:four helix bundle protein [Hymenobacter sp. ISL-91]MBT2557770.1 four helix bundle protein [Hymenobacter sp. ISL-91]